MRKKTSFVSSSLSVVPAPSSFACGLSLRATDNGPRTKDQQDKGRLFRIHYIHYSPFIIHPSPFILHPSYFILPSRVARRLLGATDLLQELARPLQARVRALARPEGIERGVLAVPLPQEPAKRASQRVVQPAFHLHGDPVRLLELQQTPQAVRDPRRVRLRLLSSAARPVGRPLVRLRLPSSGPRRV